MVGSPSGNPCRPNGRSLLEPWRCFDGHKLVWHQKNRSSFQTDSWIRRGMNSPPPAAYDQSYQWFSLGLFINLLTKTVLASLVFDVCLLLLCYVSIISLCIKGYGGKTISLKPEQISDCFAETWTEAHQTHCVLVGVLSSWLVLASVGGLWFFSRTSRWAAECCFRQASLFLWFCCCCDLWQLSYLTQ